MLLLPRIDQALQAALAHGDGRSAPAQLSAALRYAVFPGGARIRPQLCLAVAAACGEDDRGLSVAAAAAIELLHCASLVHDDLPCFDDAALRRGKPSLHQAYGQPIAVLTGDALIILAFETLARAAADRPQRLTALTLAVGRGVGMPAGIVAGQAWECEPCVELSAYQRAKTGSLFAAAARAGAISAGAEDAPWQALGERLGEAYQIADDLRDAVADADEVGKPCGQDIAKNRPSSARELGIDGAVRRLQELLDAAVASIPPCAGTAQLRAMILGKAQDFLPAKLRRAA